MSEDVTDPYETAIHTAVLGALVNWWRKDGTEMDETDIDQCADAARDVTAALYPLLRPAVLDIPAVTLTPMFTPESPLDICHCGHSRGAHNDPALKSECVCRLCPCERFVLHTSDSVLR